MCRQQKLPTFCHQSGAFVMRIWHCGSFSKPVMLELPCQPFCVMQKQHDSSRPRHLLLHLITNTDKHSNRLDAALPFSITEWALRAGGLSRTKRGCLAAGPGAPPADYCIPTGFQGSAELASDGRLEYTFSDVSILSVLKSNAVRTGAFVSCAKVVSYSW